MEDHSKDDKMKKNTRSMPVAKIFGGGGGSLGMGGIVLFGGALVTATIVSAALAFKARRSSKKSRSPSPETHTVNGDEPDQLEFAVNNVSLGSKNQSDDVSSMKEMQSKSIQDLNQEEKQNFDEKAESEFSVVGKDEDSVFESKKIALEVEVGLEEDSCAAVVNGGEEEEQRYCHENSQQTEGDGTQKSSLSIEAFSVTDYEAIEEVEVGGGDEKEMPSGLIIVEELAAAACVNHQVEEKDYGDKRMQELSYAADGESSVAIGEEPSDTVCVCVGVQEDNEEKGGDCTDDTILHFIRQHHQQPQYNHDEIAIQAAKESQTYSTDAVVTQGIPQLAMNKEETHKELVNIRDVNADHPHIPATQFIENKDKDMAEAEMMITDTAQSHQVRSDVDEANKDGQKIEESMEEDDTILLGKDRNKNESDHNNTKRLTQAPTSLLYHCSYSELLPFQEISRVAGLLLLFILMALGTDALQRFLVT